MTKYYNKDIPTEIHCVYGGRHSGKTYYELKKLKEEYITLEKDYGTSEIENDKLRKRIEKAIEYITKNIELNNGALSNKEELIVSKHDLIKNETDVLNCLKKILKGEE